MVALLLSVNTSFINDDRFLPNPVAFPAQRTKVQKASVNIFQNPPGLKLGNRKIGALLCKEQ
ncbi:MAG: hypothetical protein K0S36_2461 [Nitrosospira multiformis]|jgi:hypothetical protein|nr:hypothetical protein [Nitrosospira multiformis]